MTTLIIEIPEEEVTDISNIVKAKGGKVFESNPDEENLTVDELESLKRGLREALLIREGKVKSIPFSELWDE